MKRALAISTIAMAALTGCALGAETQATPDEQEPIAEASAALGGSFMDPMDTYNPSLWSASDGWSNGGVVNCAWRGDHVSQRGILTLALDTVQSSGKRYSSGQYKSLAIYGYGKAETRMLAAKNDGIVTAFFTYTGPTDGNPWDEIDFEILGKDTTKVQLNYFKNGTGGHERVINLGFDAAAAYHNYAIVWTSSAITWKVDGTTLHQVTGTASTLPSHPMHVMMNLWNGSGVDPWLKPFVYPGKPIQASFDWAKYTASVTQ